MEKRKPGLKALAKKWHRLIGEVQALHEEEQDLRVRQNVRSKDLAANRDDFAAALGHHTAVQIGDTVYANSDGSIIHRTLTVVQR